MLPDRLSAGTRPLTCLIVILAMVLAGVSARDYAGCWNDGSRLATVESLVDAHTLAIDESIFVKVPETGTPYGGDSIDTVGQGTLDKLYINGHYYSDKSPVPALLMAGAYQVWEWLTGLTARSQPQSFCWVMTLLFSGLAYVAAVWSIWELGQPLHLGRSLRLLLTASFALATVAPTYSRQVNNHILLLGVAGPLFVELAWLAEEVGAGLIRRRRLLTLGLLAGLGYSIDLGAGPVLLVGTFAVVTWRCRRASSLAFFVVALLPGLLTHHVVNYLTGGTFKPANANPEYFLWPDCPFTPDSLTGSIKHSPLGFVWYALKLLFGRRGFLSHNLPLLLAVPAAVALLRRRTAELPEVLVACCWSGGTWLAYALTSNNSSGLCCSIRWFVPLLVPGYYVLAVFLRECPAARGDFVVLSGWGAVLGAMNWRYGPWINHLLPGWLPVFLAALLCWAIYRCRSGRRAAVVGAEVTAALERAA